jgi:hypothetical protein
MAPMIALSWGFEAVFVCAGLAYAIALLAARSDPQIRDATAVTIRELEGQRPRQ